MQCQQQKSSIDESHSCHCRSFPSSPFTTSNFGSPPNNQLFTKLHLWSSGARAVLIHTEAAEDGEQDHSLPWGPFQLHTVGLEQWSDWALCNSALTIMHIIIIIQLRPDSLLYKTLGQPESQCFAIPGETQQRNKHFVSCSTDLNVMTLQLKKHIPPFPHKAQFPPQTLFHGCFSCKLTPASPSCCWLLPLVCSVFGILHILLLTAFRGLYKLFGYSL